MHFVLQLPGWDDPPSREDIKVTVWVVTSYDAYATASHGSLNPWRMAQSRCCQLHPVLSEFESGMGSSLSCHNTVLAGCTDSI